VNLKAHIKDNLLNMNGVCKDFYQGGYTHQNADELISGGQANVCDTKLSYSTLATYDDGDSLMLAYTICLNAVDYILYVLKPRSTTFCVNTF
jgi:hypothetical protein